MHTKTLPQSAVLTGLALLATFAHAQTWTTLTNAPPAGISNCMLLTDGGVLCQSGQSFYKLAPDLNGSYLNGTWSPAASLPSAYDPLYVASMVLANGKAVIIGGEYSFGNFALSNMGAIYDPVADTWTMLSPPPSTGSPNHWECIGDAPATILPDGRFLIGSKLYHDLAVLDPNTLTWTLLSESGKHDTLNSEEGWTLLPDGSVFTLDVAKAPAAERLLISGNAGAWVSAGNTSQDLHTPETFGTHTAPGCPAYTPPGEMGPALLRPDGTVFAIGASGFTAIYTPPPAGSTATGTFAIGPAMPSGLNVEDGPAALLPNGHVLFGGSPGDTNPGLQYFEFDGVNLNSVPAPANAANDATYSTQLLVLPTGQVLFIDGSNLVQLYTPATSPTYNPAWAPTITSFSPNSKDGPSTYQIYGTQFNGLGQGTAYGDEQQNPTNYPLVRITNNASGHVFYARTHDHSTMGVATGTAIVSTNFDLPANIETGAGRIQVVANGIPSAPLPITVTQNLNLLTGTTSTLVANPSTAAQGDPVVLTATVSGTPAPTGNVTFSNGATILATEPLNGSGVATLTTTTTLPLGTLSLTASYSGNANDAPSTSSPIMVTIHSSLGSPAVVSLTPNSGSGASQIFTATYSDPNGAADLATLRLLFNTSVSAVNACYVTYLPASNQMYLYNNAGTALSAPVTPGSSATVSNSQCTLSGTGSSYSTSGDNGTLTAALKFAGTAPQNVYLESTALTTGASSGWVQKGTWGVSVGLPLPVSVSPASGTGTAQTFTAAYTDPNGAGDLATVGVLINSNLSGVDACYVIYNRAVNGLYLVNDAGKLTTPITPGSSATASNSQCTLSAKGSSYSTNGKTATLTLALTFTGSTAQKVFLDATENNGTNSGWLLEGTWTP